MAVYLLHFLSPLHHARHYIGYSSNLQSLMFRVAEHRAGVSRAAGRPVAIMKALHAAGIGFELARVWPLGDRGLELRLKRRSRGIRPACPVCSGEPALRLAKDLAEEQTAFQFKKSKRGKKTICATGAEGGRDGGSESPSGVEGSPHVPPSASSDSLCERPSQPPPDRL